LALFKSQTLGYPVIIGSHTWDTLAVDLTGRSCIVVHRDDDPQQILKALDTEKCFIIGGGRTYTRFAPYLTHLYLTPHPLLFGSGIPLFPGLKRQPQLTLETMIPIRPKEGIYQFQFSVNYGDNHHTH
jgi:dihydrofolate reductase